MSQKDEVIKRLIELEGQRIILQKQVVDLNIQINMLYVKLRKIWRQEDGGTESKQEEDKC